MTDTVPLTISAGSSMLHLTIRCSVAPTGKAVNSAINPYQPFETADCTLAPKCNLIGGIEIGGIVL